MSHPSPNSEELPESSQPRVEQHSSGTSLGGQQAAIGNNNNQFQDNSTNYSFNFYGELQDADLESLSLQGKALSYFGVFIFLVPTLIFWFFFGLFINFPFPFRQAIELIGSCFTGKAESRVNSLQKQLQLENIESQSVKKLNEIDFQARLYLKTLEYLGADKGESHERLARTIEALKQKRVTLQNEIKPRQPRKYQTVNKVQDFFESFTLNQAEKDLVQIETILTEVTWSIKNDYPSETIVQDTINKLSREVTRRANKISPARLGLLYRMQALLYEISTKQISNLGESELNDLNRKLKEERDSLVRKFDRLLDEKKATQQRLEDYSEETYRLNRLINEHKSELLELQERISRYTGTNQSQQITINTLSTDLAKTKERLGNLQGQKNDLNEEITRLKQALSRKQTDIEKLVSQVNQYSEIRMLQGEYIGNLSDPKSKYHFDRKCNHWKMLVGEYVLGLDRSREIVSSNNSNFFIGRLEECDRCAGRKNYFS